MQEGFDLSKEGSTAEKILSISAISESVCISGIMDEFMISSPKVLNNAFIPYGSFFGYFIKIYIFFLPFLKYSQVVLNLFPSFSEI
jgi:hypothetical protein